MPILVYRIVAFYNNIWCAVNTPILILERAGFPVLPLYRVDGMGEKDRLSAVLVEWFKNLSAFCI